MSLDRLDEVEEHVARLLGSGNGQAPADGEELDWLLFHSFPGSDLDPARLAALLPRYEAALDAGVDFDFELLFIRALELDRAIGDEARRSLARTAMRRVRADAFDPSDAVTALRFALRVLPPDEFLAPLLEDPALERLRFHLTVDFTLDERSLDDYLALSYLRDGDRDADRVLARYPVPAVAHARLAESLAEPACRRRLEAGFPRWTDPSERELLARALSEKLPGIRLGDDRGA